MLFPFFSGLTKGAVRGNDKSDKGVNEGVSGQKWIHEKRRKYHRKKNNKREVP